MTATAIITEALSWRGTPWLEQACVKEHGVDCVMLIKAVGQVAGGLVVDPAKEAQFKGYSRQPSQLKIVKACDLFLTRIDFNDRAPADVLCFDLGAGPQHLGILTSRQTIVHAYEGAGVVETGIAPDFRPYKAAWRFPGLA